MRIPKDAHIWLPGCIARRRPPRAYPASVLFAFVDHFEPEQKPGDAPELQLSRVREWIARYENAVAGHADTRGRAPQHTYFFPEEQYRSETIELLAAHCARGFGEVEVHIHHDGDTGEGFRAKIIRFIERLAGHGLLARDRVDGRTRYGFIHGNWSLDNSRADGRWCGVNNEITILRETGCYADFTMPSAPMKGGTQTRTVNSIYFADDDPRRPKSHDRGRPVAFGAKGIGDLLLIQGPLALSWRGRSRAFLPRIENGDVSLTNPVTADRVRLWIDLRIGVRGKEDVIFVKVHTHGLKPRNFDFLLGGGIEAAFRIVEGECGNAGRLRLYYVSAREMANVVYALNDGVDRPIEELFDYRLAPPGIRS